MITEDPAGSIDENSRPIDERAITLQVRRDRRREALRNPAVYQSCRRSPRLKTGATPTRGGGNTSIVRRRPTCDTTGGTGPNPKKRRKPGHGKSRQWTRRKPQQKKTIAEASTSVAPKARRRPGKASKDPKTSPRRSPRALIPVQSLEEKLIAQLLERTDEAAVEKFEVEGKGWGIRSVIPVRKGDFVVEYVGELISYREALKRDEERENDENIGCYMFYLWCKSGRVCIDATDYLEFKGRYVNHSKRNANLEAKVITTNNQTRLVFYAKRDIAAQEELLIDYNDNRSEAKINNPWLND